MSRFLASLLLTGACAALIGLVTGYYVGVVDGTPLSLGLVAILGLILVAVALAYQSGLRAGRAAHGESTRVEGQEALRQELDRSRRFGRSFVLMRFPLPPGTAEPATEVDPRGEMLEMMLRSIDRAWSVKDTTYVLLPESTREAARDLAARLSRALPRALALERVEYAEFPADGVTTGALLANLRPDGATGDVAPVRLMRDRRAEPADDVERRHRTS